MAVVIYSFDVFELLILPFDLELSVLNFPRTSVLSKGILLNSRFIDFKV